MANLDDLTVLNDVRERLAAITSTHIDAAERKLSKQREDTTGDTVIGVIESPSTRALYALVIQLTGTQEMEKAMARSALDDTAELDHQQKAAVLDMFEDVVAQLFWTQAKLDLGFQEIASVALRPNWILVKTKETGMVPPAFLTALMGGGRS